VKKVGLFSDKISKRKNSCPVLPLRKGNEVILAPAGWPFSQEN
jgi:hypothetical protein